jgi:hypothetical protein
MAKKTRIPHKFHPWINARKQFRLSDAHIQMARELGLSPKRFGKYADRENQPWKLPLTEFIDAQYLKQFGKERPDEVKSMEDIAAEHVAKRAARKLVNSQTAKETVNSTTKPPQNAGDESTAAGDISQASKAVTTGDDTTSPTSDATPRPEVESADATSEQQPDSNSKPEQQ